MKVLDDISQKYDKKIYPSIPGNKNWPRCIILSRISINFCKLPIIYKAASQNENYKRFKDKHIWNERRERRT